jgi:sialate O-acetylesterase
MELKTILQNWSVASNTSIGGPGWSYTSAVCWFTYRNVFNELGGKVPQGIIGNNWGGTPIQHWSSPDALKVCNGGVDSTLWNAMIVPYVTGPMTVRTAIWYQGESNVGQASYYDCQFTAMISDWRAKLPSLSTFGFVQIAAYTGYGNAPGGDLRQAQLSPLTNLPRIAFATAIDLVYPYSAPGDIHPIAKQLISKRLSDSLLATEYSIVNTGPSISPFYSGATTKTNGVSISVSVTITGCVDGCSATTPYFVPPGVTDAQVAGFQIQTNDAAKTWWNATATMSSDGNSIILSVTAPTTGLAAIASAYGRATWPVVTHYNSIGLPVIPWCFTIEGISCYSANNTEYSGPNAPRFQEPPRE